MAPKSRKRTVFWIGPQGSAPQDWGALSETTEVFSYEAASGALGAAADLLPDIVLVFADWFGASPAIQELVRADLGMPVVAVTNRPIPLSLMKAVSSGASQIVGAQKDATLAARIGTVLNEWEERKRENELLREMNELTKEFLKTLISLEQRNLLLSETKGETSTEVDVHPTRILVIDDEPGVCRLFDILLEDTFDVRMVRNGEDGLAVLEQGVYPVVIVDKNLPGMNGLEVLRRINTEHPLSSVIIITGYSSEDAAIQAINLGASAYLQKPFDDVHAVQKTVLEVFEKSRSRAQSARHLSIIKQRNREFLEKYQHVQSELSRLMELRDLHGDEIKRGEN